MYCAAAEPNEIKAFLFSVLLLPDSLRDESVFKMFRNSCFVEGIERVSRDEMLMTPRPVACLPIG